MSVIKLYWSMVSQPARAVKSLLDSKKVEYESVHLDLFVGEHKKPEYLAINPAG